MMSLYDNEENAIVNNDNDVSETPSNLVNNNLDLETSQEELDKKLQYKRDGNVNESKLSPNPAGFGFTKQLFITPENTATNGEPNVPGEPNVLYLVQVLNNGVLVGYRKYKWTPSDGFVQFGATPDLKLVNGPRETPTRVENAPKKKPDHVFNGLTVFNGEIYVNGKKTEFASGGTVEAEPIISIKMTNMDCTGIDGNENRFIRDLQFYCTKERWDNFVSLASSMMSVDVTYANFDSVFKTLSVNHQATVIGYLLMDYYNGKVLPEAYLQINQTVESIVSIVAKNKYGLVDLTTLTDPQTNIEVAMAANFKGSFTSGSATTNESGAIPAPDMVNTNYYTTDTVITVEEIAGPAIGSSSGSAESRYRATINLEVDSVSQFRLIFDFFEFDLDNSIDELNAGLSQMGVTTTITKENWSTVVPTLLNQMIQLGSAGQTALIQSLGLLLQNCYKCISENMDGYTTDIAIIVGAIVISGNDIIFGTNTVSFTSSTLVKISQ